MVIRLQDVTRLSLSPSVRERCGLTVLRLLLLAGLLLCASRPVEAQMATGSYVGNGTAGRPITGLGFQPDIVIVKVDYVDTGTANNDNSVGVMRTSTMAGDSSKLLGQMILGLQPNLIQSLDADGFTVGNDIRVNALNSCGAGTDPCTYYWTAFKANANVKVGTYTGNGIVDGDTQPIGGLGFSPEYVVVLCQQSDRALQRTSRGTNQTVKFVPGSTLLDAIVSLDPNGFTVMKSTDSNNDPNTNTQTYHYAAWNEVPGKMKVGEYAGNRVDNRGITGVGFQPRYLIIHRYNDGSDSFQRSDRMSGDASVNFRGAITANAIQALSTDGFVLGTATQVNHDPGQCSGGSPPGDCLYAYVAFGAVTTNYRSIGTAPDDSTGSVNTTNNSTIVDGVGTSWLAINRGPGDVISICDQASPTCTTSTNYTVLAVESNTRLRLTTPYTGSTAEHGYTIRRQFRGAGNAAQALIDWENCIDGGGSPCGPYPPVASNSLVADERREVGIAYKDSVFKPAATVRIRGSTTAAAYNIVLTVAAGNRHNGTAATPLTCDPCANVVYDGMGTATALRISDDNVTVEWFEFRQLWGSNGMGSVMLDEVVAGQRAENILLQNLLVHDFMDGNALLTTMGIKVSNDPPGGSTLTIRNVMIWNGDNHGIAGDEADDRVVVENCTIDNMSGQTTGKGINPEASILTVINTIATRSASEDFNTGCAPGCYSAASTNNTSSDGTAPGPNPQTASAASLYVAPGSNLHLIGGAVAIDQGADLSSSFGTDIDYQVRPAGAGWDRGADESGATTAVRLLSFAARGLDSAVELSWQTGSELNNLGFHLYRSTSAGGPSERITASVIPGLGSSPEGAGYSYRDTGLVNGVTYFYRLEDIETTGKTELHGPVSATPQAGITYGDPSRNALRVMSRGPGQAVLELVTQGFSAIPQKDGSVRIEVPGFQAVSPPGSPSIPARRAWVEAVAGRQVRLGEVRAVDVTAFAGLRPVPAASPEMVVGTDGTVRAGVRRRGEGAVFRRAGPYPEQAARVVEVGFQGDVKKALLELSPLRWDAASQQLLLARRLVVRVVFSGVEPSERSLGGSRGRGHEETHTAASHTVLAQLLVRSKGLYGVSFEEVFGAQGREVSVSRLRLSRQGQTAAFHVEPDAETFGPGSVPYFLSEGGSVNPYGETAVYELALGPGGTLMPVGSASPSGSAVGSYRTLSEFEVNRTYQSALMEARDPWLWEGVISPGTKSYPFTLSGLANSAEPSRLEVLLQGASDFEADPDHHVRILLNGVVVGEASWDGKLPQVVEADLPRGLLQEGSNQLEVQNVGDTGAAYSYVFLDKFSLSYPRRVEAEGGVLSGSFSESGAAEVVALGAGSLVLETTEVVPRWLRGVVSTAAGLSFGVEAGRSYLAVAWGSVLKPELRRPLPTNLRSTENRADYLLIGPGEFLSEAEPLLERRRSQGLVVKAVAVEEVYQEFGHGESTPEAVKEFLSYAYHHWQAPSARYVVLFGDGTYDFKNYLQTGRVNRVVPRLVRTSYMWTASDPSYASVNGEDELPDLAVGRLSAGSVEEARVLVGKVLAFEDGGLDLGGPAVLVSDNADVAGNFEADSEEIASLLGEREVERIYLRDLGVSGVRGAVIEAFNRGAGLMSYVGHGGVAVWASENVFNNLDVNSLTAQSRQPFLMTTNCLNGYFHGPTLDSLAEVLVKASGKGAVGAFSPTGLSVDAAAHVYQKALIGELTPGTHERLGDAILAAQAAYADTGAMPELLSIYHLLGDPGLKLK